MPRHQCLLYEGPPSRHLRALAAVIRDQLRRNYRCLYFNSQPMIAGMRSYLAAADVDVAAETARGRILFSAERPHLTRNGFDVDFMLRSLERELDRALQQGYAGLWATGDMTWELGSGVPDCAKLVEYERRLEKLLELRPELSGVCQYHAGSLPKAALQHALETHRATFLSESSSLLNLHYKPPELETC